MGIRVNLDGEEEKMSLSITIVGIVFLGLVLFFILRKGASRDQRPAAVRPTKAGASTTFHAVSIKFASSACSAAKSLEGKRFLSGAAPQIPLPDCDVLECKCRFAHYSDRRESDDRRNPYRAGIAGETGKHNVEQRRGPRDRRDRPPPKKI